MGTPKVGSPKVRVSGRPRKAIATASPALAVRGPVSTATGGIGWASGSPGPHRSAYWRGVPLSIVHGVRVPSASTKAPTSPSLRMGPAEASGVHMWPPVLARRSTTQPQAPARSTSRGAGSGGEEGRRQEP
ncbi:hypothetical protein WQ59_00990 [Streptomyces sp. KE1]|nr:hypothetical protein WQ59_00990 [Streptomyces sp. KE1]